MAEICGIDAETLRDVARTFCRCQGGNDFLGYGVCRNTSTALITAVCLISLALMTGQVGRPGSGSAPAARSEQRARRVRCRHDPDVPARLFKA